MLDELNRIVRVHRIPPVATLPPQQSQTAAAYLFGGAAAAWVAWRRLRGTAPTWFGCWLGLELWVDGTISLELCY